MAPPPGHDTPPVYKLPGMGWMPNSVRNHFIAMSGEFTGTFLFLFFALSATQVANSSQPSDSPDQLSQSTSANVPQLLYISLAFGFSLAVNVWVFFRISGGLFNPAVRRTTIMYHQPSTKAYGGDRSR